MTSPLLLLVAALTLAVGGTCFLAAAKERPTESQAAPPVVRLDELPAEARLWFQ